ncbi:hypothetical protein NE237_020527 [Protea cynaroides]|uniref:Uncharacterized protein n=1 Tax=Protea cynaroides TaxID=273540 RepID=A0A9Q0K2N6_9MAGN|nr:hypothetical protein NE237_020527 [Protea cynaroides]
MEALEIPLINTIPGFEASINLLQNPSFLSRIIDLLGIDKTFLNYNFWTWGALILAIVATFSGVINRTKLFIPRLWRQQRSVNSEDLLRPFVDDDDDDSCSSSSSNDEDDLSTSSLENETSFDEDFRVADGSCSYDEDQRHHRLKLRRQFSWSGFTSRKSVVKLWDDLGLGLGLRFEDSSTESVVSMWDLHKDEIISSFHGGGGCQIPAISWAAPSVMLTAGLEECGNVAAVRVWDARVSSQIPAFYAEWQPRWRSILGVDSSEMEKVYLIDNRSSVTVRDIRKVTKVGFPLESEENTWWDNDAVIVSDEDREGCCFNRLEASPMRIHSSIMSRCRDAMKSYFF